MNDRRFQKRSHQLQQCRSFSMCVLRGTSKRSRTVKFPAECGMCAPRPALPACMSEAHACPIICSETAQQQQRDQKRYKYTPRVLGTYKNVSCIHLHTVSGSPTNLPISLIIKLNHSRSLPKAPRKQKLFSLVTHSQALRIAYPRKLNPHSSISPPRIHSAKQGKDGIDAIFCATRKRTRPFDPKVRGYRTLL